MHVLWKDNVTISDSYVKQLLGPIVTIDVSLFTQLHLILSPPHRLVILSPPCHLVTSPPYCFITMSPYLPADMSPYHLTTPLSCHPTALSLSSPCPCPHLVLVLTLSLSSLRLISYLRRPLSIPFLRHGILPSLVPALLISILILMYHLYSSFHLRPSSRPLVSPFVLVSTCSLILDLMLPVFFSHHRHPSPGSRIPLYLCFLFCTCTAWSMLAFSLVLILLHM